MLRLMLFLAAFLPAFAHAQPTDKVLQRIRDTKKVTIAYRTDAKPFSLQEEGGQPAGYTVELCKRVVASFEQRLQSPAPLREVGSRHGPDPARLVRKGDVDMKCGRPPPRSPHAAGRLSNPVWVDTTGLIVRKSVGAKGIGGLAGKSIAAVAGTPNLKALEEALKKGLVNAKVVPAKTYDEAIALLEGGKTEALAAGKTMLLGIGGKLKDPGAYDVLSDDIGYVPYAIVLPLGANGLRLAVNRALSQIYNSDAIAEIFRGAFGPNAKPGGALLRHVRTQRLPGVIEGGLPLPHAERRML